MIAVKTEPSRSLPEKTAWWKDCFEDATFLRPPEWVAARVDAIARILDLEPRSRILDLCCGAGQETLELARRGHRVLGVDLTEEALRQARGEAKSEALFCHFMKVDMRNIPYSGDFDAILARHPSFGHHLHEKDDLQALASIRRALKPGGKLLMKLVNRDWVMRHLHEVPEQSGIRFHFESGRLEGHRHSRRVPAGFRLYALTEMLRLFKETGLAFKQVWGRFNGTPYGLNSFHMILLAENPRETRQAPKKEDDDLPRALKIKGRGR